jgi:hypothetical protein
MVSINQTSNIQQKGGIPNSVRSASTVCRIGSFLSGKKKGHCDIKERRANKGKIQATLNILSIKGT